MWATAHQVWSDWGYGKHEGDGAMFAPAACALDFPVVMYYASLQIHDRLAEESKLQEAIRTALANGSGQALPPPILPDADHYAETRYHYHDVNIF